MYSTMILASQTVHCWDIDVLKVQVAPLNTYIDNCRSLHNIIEDD